MKIKGGQCCPTCDLITARAPPTAQPRPVAPNGNYGNLLSKHNAE